MQGIYLAIAVLLSSRGEPQTNKFCDGENCFTVSTLTEAGKSEPLFWFTFHRYEEFRTQVIAPNQERCRYNDLLIVIGDNYVPPGTSGSYTHLQGDQAQALQSETLITMWSYRSISNFHYVLAHEWGHYLHDQYCLSVDSEVFASAMAKHFSGGDFNTQIVR